MYAAIDEQDKVYTSGSETYAQIQPTTSDTSRVVPNEPVNFGQTASRVEESHVSAPQPPSVDSLRHVAHAHSRQGKMIKIHWLPSSSICKASPTTLLFTSLASSSSATSSIVNPGSPKPEKRQANSPLPPPPEGPVDLYAQLDKRGKGDDRLRSSVCSGKSLEDMYAKVIKKKRDVEEIHTDAIAAGSAFNCDVSVPRRKLSLIEVSRASWSSHESVEIQKREQDNSQHFPAEINPNFHDVKDDYARVLRSTEVDIISSTVEVDHGYEAVDSSRKLKPIVPTTSNPSNAPDYEMLRPQYSRDPSHQIHSSAGTRNGEALPIYALPFKHRQVSDASSEDPGYERVRLPKRVELDPDTDSEPNYESMPHEPNYASVCRPGDSDADPNYESVNHNDPNYESVKYMSMAQGEDPPYEQVNSYKCEVNASGGYEKVEKEKTTDPDYEKIDPNCPSEQTNNGDTDDEQYVQV